jgi:hypothetical protein
MTDSMFNPREMSEQALRDLSPKDRLFIENMKKENKEPLIWQKGH